MTSPVLSAAAAERQRAVYQALRALLQAYADRLVVVRDSPDELYLDTPHLMPSRKPLFFGAVRQGKAHVSFYLMPLYTFPELAEALPPVLRTHQQGKSCFHFKTLDPEALDALGQLTARGYELYRKKGFVP